MLEKCKKIEVSEFLKGMSGRAENSHMWLTFCTPSNSTLNVQSQKNRLPSYMIVGSDLMEALLVILISSDK